MYTRASAWERRGTRVQRWREQARARTRAHCGEQKRQTSRAGRTQKIEDCRASGAPALFVHLLLLDTLKRVLGVVVHPELSQRRTETEDPRLRACCGCALRTSQCEPPHPREG